MPRRQAPNLYLVAADVEKRGFFGWAMRLKGILGRKTRQRPLPNALLADVLADNGLRARELERRRPQISGPWR